jgi:hypothetical protein
MDETAHFMDETAHFMDENVTFQSYGSKVILWMKQPNLWKKDTSQTNPHDPLPLLES